MMSVIVKSANCIDCLDVQNPTNLRLLKHRRWAEADAKFLMRTISAMNDKKTNNSSQETPLEEEPVYVCRQRYLRSYTFVKEDEKSVTRKTKKWLRDNCTQKNIRMRLKTKPKKKKKKKLASTGDSNSQNSDNNACSLLEVAFNFLFLCMAKVDIDDDHILLRRSTPAAPRASAPSFASRS